MLLNRLARDAITDCSENYLDSNLLYSMAGSLNFLQVCASYSLGLKWVIHHQYPYHAESIHLRVLMSGFCRHLAGPKFLLSFSDPNRFSVQSKSLQMT